MPSPNGDSNNGDESLSDKDASNQIAPDKRFKQASQWIHMFAEKGATEDMKKGVAHYIYKGLGGSDTAVHRFDSTAITAGRLFDALSATAAGQASGPNNELDPTILAGCDASVIIDAIVEAVRPVDGTQDGEASRAAIKKALSDLLRQFTGADLLSLSEEQRIHAVEHYISWDVFYRFGLDLGKMIQVKAPSAKSAHARYEKVRRFIAKKVAKKFRKLTTGVVNLDGIKVTMIVQDTIRQTLRTFEIYR